MSPLIYILDDEENIRQSLLDILEDEKFRCRAFHKFAEVKKAMESEGETPDLILLDIWLENEDGMEILARLKEQDPLLQVVMISGHGTIDLAVNATKTGAFDFLEKPLSLERVLTTVHNALKISNLEKENLSLRQKQLKHDEIVGNSDPIIKVKEIIAQSATTNARVFIRGENGTGKEMVARAIYLNSKRAREPFVEINCAAIPEELIESELFGHEKGSFTGADSQRVGKFEQAQGGTLFLDEICDMSLNMQAKVLRVLQENKLTRVGGSKIIDLDVRVLAATNINVEEAIREGTFREDLYYRLNVIPIYLPPLRRRQEDIELLVNHYLGIVAGENSIQPKRISQDGMSYLRNYDWPGNIRELRNIVERICIIFPHDEISARDIHQAIFPGQGPEPERAQPPLDLSLDLKTAREQFEREYITEVLKRNDFNITNSARVLGVERSNLHRKIKSLKITIHKEV